MRSAYGWESQIRIWTLLLLILGSCMQRREQTVRHTGRSLSATAFRQLLETLPDGQLLDVRTPDEFRQGHIPGSLNLNWNDSTFASQMVALDPRKPVLVYCLSGGRSRQAAQKLAQAGFRRIHELSGGMLAWRAAGFPESSIRTANNEMTLAQYQNLLHSDQLVLVSFHADWCAPCRVMQPQLEEIARKSAERLKLVRIDADANPTLCRILNVTALPVLRLYRHNQLQWEKQGLVEASTIQNLLDQAR